jgi:hypothetical protein
VQDETQANERINRDDGKIKYKFTENKVPEVTFAKIEGLHIGERNAEVRTVNELR